jgi:hypothetical protein
MRYINALHQGVLEAILFAVLGVIVVRRYGIHALLHPAEYRGRRVGTGRGKRFRGHSLQRHGFKDLGHMAISVQRAIEWAHLVRVPILPVYEGSWYHDRLLEGYAA